MDSVMIEMWLLDGLCNIYCQVYWNFYWIFKNLLSFIVQVHKGQMRVLL